MAFASQQFEQPQALTPGFDDQTHQSQQTFRKILAAMAEPGTVQELMPIDSPEPLSSAAYQVCLTLMDQETPLWIEPTLGSEAVMAAIRFHCGCRVVEQGAKAAFALVTDQSSPYLSLFDVGSHEYPDRSATVIVEVASLESEGCWRLTGPGIPDERHVQIGGFDQSWQRALEQNRDQFPRGVDLILTCGAKVMALPRTTRCHQMNTEGEPCMSR